MENAAKAINQVEVKNGVNLTQLGQTVAAVTGNPGLAWFKFRAKNKWVDGGHNQIAIKDYYGQGQELSTRSKPFVFDADEPPALLGKDIGANPVEYVLAALSACMTTSLVYHGAAQGITFDRIESDYEGDIDLQGFLGTNPAVRKGYQEIRVNFKVKSDGDKNALEDLIKKSPVFDIISNPTPIKVSVAVDPRK